MKVMFDTNVFNHILNGEIEPHAIDRAWEPVATHLQWDEISKTPDDQRRRELQQIFEQFVKQSVATSAAVFGVSKWGQSKYATSESHYAEIASRLVALKRRKGYANEVDALIADTCIQNGLLLVTNDGNLKEVAQAFGCAVCDISSRGR